jgi:hypothetical protein
VIHTLVYLGLFAKHVMPMPPVVMWVSSWFCLPVCRCAVLLAVCRHVSVASVGTLVLCGHFVCAAVQLYDLARPNPHAMVLNSNLLLYGTVLGSMMSWNVKIADTRLK